MKPYHFTLLIAAMAFLIAACSPGDLYFECDGFYIAPYTEDISASAPLPVAVPFEISARITDSRGNLLFTGPLLTIDAAFILSTNGGFHEYYEEPELQPLRIYLTVPGVVYGELAEMISVDCGSPIVYFTDDRIGPDTATSLNAYQQANGLHIYSESNGSFFVSFDAINAVGNPTQNTLISSYNGIDVYVLTDGLIQIMESVASDGKRDILIIDLDDEGNVTRWRRGTFNTLTGESNIHLQSDAWDGYPMNF